MDHEHVLALVETVNGADLDAVHGFAANTAIIDDVGQFSAPRTKGLKGYLPRAATFVALFAQPIAERRREMCGRLGRATREQLEATAVSRGAGGAYSAPIIR
jgi:hypothetical protein